MITRRCLQTIPRRLQAITGGTPTITIAGDVLLPVGYVSTSQIPVDDYLATHPQ